MPSSMASTSALRLLSRTWAFPMAKAMPTPTPTPGLSRSTVYLRKARERKLQSALSPTWLRGTAQPSISPSCRTFSSSIRSSAATRPPTPPPERELPDIPSRRPVVLAAIFLALTSWTAFTLYAMNDERASSSAFRSALLDVKDSPAVHSLLGEPIVSEVKWYAGGKPWVDGSINLMQGRVDIKFRVKGPKDGATVYFSSIRPSQLGRFENLRFLVVSDSGEKVSLLGDDSVSTRIGNSTSINSQPGTTELDAGRI